MATVLPRSWGCAETGPLPVRGLAGLSPAAWGTRRVSPRCRVVQGSPREGSSPPAANLLPGKVPVERRSEKRVTPPPVVWARRLLIIADDVIHIAVAALLVVAGAMMLVYAVKNFAGMDVVSILLVVNDALFVLIIAEVLWTIIRYLRREKFSLLPFLFIGIISSLRRILVIDAQMSLGESERSFNQSLMELGAHVAIIFMLVVAYYLVKKAKSLELLADREWRRGGRGQEPRRRRPGAGGNRS